VTSLSVCKRNVSSECCEAIRMSFHSFLKHTVKSTPHPLISMSLNVYKSCQSGLAFILGTRCFWKTWKSCPCTGHEGSWGTGYVTLPRVTQIIKKIQSRLFKKIRFQAESGWNFSSILTLVGSGHHKPARPYQCRTYSRKLLMMGREDARNM
jgi:hypothetical protein